MVGIELDFIKTEDVMEKRNESTWEFCMAPGWWPGLFTQKRRLVNPSIGEKSQMF
jgi:hypothetical protein